MAYRLYNLISPYSFRVQLAKMEVYDAAHPQRHYSKYAFFIEDESQFEERTQGKFRDTLLKSQRELLRDDLLKLYVFQYMIGNTDWNLGLYIITIRRCRRKKGCRSSGVHYNKKKKNKEV